MCKELLVLLIFCFTIFPVIVYFLVRIVKEKDKVKRGKYATILLLFLLICPMIPFYSIIDILPFQHSNIEEAFKFDYNDIFNRERYKLIFKKKHKNTYFVVGRELNASWFNQDIFNCYTKNKNGWRPVIQIFDYETGYNDDSGYDIYYCSNEKDDVTGIFITSLSANFKDNLKIEDKYGTKFDYIKNNNEPIKYRNEDNYIYFGIVNQSIDNSDYYIKIKDKKVKLK